MTHDSIGLGEDGPTHQPVEVLSLLRATPNLRLFRPADGNEVAAAYACGTQHHGPTVIALTRQGVPALPNSSIDNALLGAYIVSDTASDASAATPEVVLIATGSEVGLALKAASLLSTLKARVVSAPCLELFRKQPAEYRRSVLPLGVPIISIEALGPVGWAEFAHKSIAVPAWGASAPGAVVMEKLGFSPEKVAAVTTEFLAAANKLVTASASSVAAFGALPCHYD